MINDSSVKQSFQCPIYECNLKFDKRLKLRNHLIYSHNKYESIFECPICKKMCPSLKDLKIHEKVHGEYSCETCGQKFTEKSYLELHTKIHDAQRPVFVCSTCGKGFFFKGNLTTHVKLKHLKMLFKCFICEKEVSTNQKLKEHVHKKHELKNECIDINISDSELLECHGDTF